MEEDKAETQLEVIFKRFPDMDAAKFEDTSPVTQAIQKLYQALAKQDIRQIFAAMRSYQTAVDQAHGLSNAQLGITAQINKLLIELPKALAQATRNGKMMPPESSDVIAFASLLQPFQRDKIEASVVKLKQAQSVLQAGPATAALSKLITLVETLKTTPTADNAQKVRAEIARLKTQYPTKLGALDTDLSELTAALHEIEEAEKLKNNAPKYENYLRHHAVARAAGLRNDKPRRFLQDDWTLAIPDDDTIAELVKDLNEALNTGVLSPREFAHLQLVQLGEELKRVAKRHQVTLEEAGNKQLKEDIDTLVAELKKKEGERDFTAIGEKIRAIESHRPPLPDVAKLIASIKTSRTLYEQSEQTQQVLYSQAARGDKPSLLSETGEIQFVEPKDDLTPAKRADAENKAISEGRVSLRDYALARVSPLLAQLDAVIAKLPDGDPLKTKLKELRDQIDPANVAPVNQIEAKIHEIKSMPTYATSPLKTKLDTLLDNIEKEKANIEKAKKLHAEHEEYQQYQHAQSLAGEEAHQFVDADGQLSLPDDNARATVLQTPVETYNQRVDAGELSLTEVGRQLILRQRDHVHDLNEQVQALTPDTDEAIARLKRDFKELDSIISQSDKWSRLKTLLPLIRKNLGAIQDVTLKAKTEQLLTQLEDGYELFSSSDRYEHLRQLQAVVGIESPPVLVQGEGDAIQVQLPDVEKDTKAVNKRLSEQLNNNVTDLKTLATAMYEQYKKALDQVKTKITDDGLKNQIDEFVQLFHEETDVQTVEKKFAAIKKALGGANGLTEEERKQIAGALDGIRQAILLAKESRDVEQLRQMHRLLNEDVEVFDKDARLKEEYSDPQKRKEKEAELLEKLTKKFEIQNVQAHGGEPESVTIYSDSKESAAALMHVIANKKWKNVTVRGGKDSQVLAAARVALQTGTNVTFKPRRVDIKFKPAFGGSSMHFEIGSLSTLQKTLNQIFATSKELRESDHFKKETEFADLFKKLLAEHSETLPTYLQILQPADVRELFRTLDSDNLQHLTQLLTRSNRQFIPLDLLFERWADIDETTRTRAIQHANIRDINAFLEEGRIHSESEEGTLTTLVRTLTPEQLRGISLAAIEKNLSESGFINICLPRIFSSKPPEAFIDYFRENYHRDSNRSVHLLLAMDEKQRVKVFTHKKFEPQFQASFLRWAFKNVQSELAKSLIAQLKKIKKKLLLKELAKENIIHQTSNQPTDSNTETLIKMTQEALGQPGANADDILTNTEKAKILLEIYPNADDRQVIFSRSDTPDDIKLALYEAECMRVRQLKPSSIVPKWMKRDSSPTPSVKFSPSFDPPASCQGKAEAIRKKYGIGDNDLVNVPGLELN